MRLHPSIRFLVFFSVSTLLTIGMLNVLISVIFIIFPKVPPFLVEAEHPVLWGTVLFMVAITFVEITCLVKYFLEKIWNYKEKM